MRFRLINKDDVNDFYALVKKNQSHIRDYFPKTSMATASLEKAAAIVSEFLHKMSINEMFVFLAEDAVTKQLRGVFFIKEIDGRHSKCEIAYFVDKEFQGQGIASNGVNFLKHFIFDELKLNKICCRISTENHGSNKVVHRNGFHLEGLLKKEFKISNGRFIDINCYGLLAKNDL